jgi:flagellar protein FliT
MVMANEVVHWYSQLALTVTRMLALARARQWTGLPELDGECTAIVDRLRELAPASELAPLDRARVVALMTRIRADQDQLAGIIRPQFARLMRRIDELQREQKVRSTYRGTP